MKASKVKIAALLCAGIVSVSGCAAVNKSNSELVLDVFDDVRTGSTKGMDYYSDSEYVQHNLGMQDGKSAVGAFFS